MTILVLHSNILPIALRNKGLVKCTILQVHFFKPTVTQHQVQNYNYFTTTADQNYAHAEQFGIRLGYWPIDVLCLFL